ncbi:MAG: hypothetical protein OXE99_09955 [Cellvibrionales bacterium]|nr:hypothetical protein [Cellvibrionales bacterium]
MHKLFFVLILFTPLCFSLEQKKYLWLEPGFSWDGSRGEIYHVANISFNGGYKYFVAKFDIREVRDVTLFSDYINKNTGKEFEKSIKERNLLVGLSHYGSWYRLTSTLGIGYLRVDTPKNCEIRYSSPSFFGNDEYNCEQATRERLTVPVNITAFIGRYAGFGIQGNATFSNIDNYYSLGFIVPLGRFN